MAKPAILKNSLSIAQARQSETNMSITFKRARSKLYLIYEPSVPELAIEKWNRFIREGEYSLQRTFFFQENNLKDAAGDEESGFSCLTFLLGTKQHEYFHIDKAVLDTELDVYIQESVFVNHEECVYADIDLLPALKGMHPHRIFFAHQNISVFKKISALCKEGAIFVGGNNSAAIPLHVFNSLIAQFPTTAEKNHYMHSRITNILKEYIPTMSDEEQRFQNYLRSRENRFKKDKDFVPGTIVGIPIEVFKYEIRKFEYILGQIKEWLNGDLRPIHERKWQKLIATILPLIFPQYIAVLTEVKIKESYSNKIKTTGRKIDFVLVNADGYIDILEIKTPLPEVLKSEYRDNYPPSRELSGAVMQVEKYIYYLNSLNPQDEKKLTQKYKDRRLLPADLDLKIRNPKGMVLLGKNEFNGQAFDEQQKTDFELIKRKYSNIADILTYDDLVSRIDNIIQTMKKKANV